MSLVPLNGADTLSTLKFDSSAASARSFDQDVRIPPYFVRENAGDFFVENSDWNGDDAWLDRINNDVVGDETSTAGNVERDYIETESPGTDTIMTFFCRTYLTSFL